MRKNKFLILAVTLVITAILSLGAFAADDIVFEFTDENSFKGWGTGYLRYNFDPGYFNGYAYEKSANLSDPMFFTPELNIQAEDYRYIIIHMSYTRDASWSKVGQIFFRGTGQSAFAAERCVSGPEYKSTSSGFTDVVFDMTKSANWTGTIVQLRIDPFDCPGTVGIKKITLTNTLPEPEQKEEVKPETPKEDETPKKQTGVFLKPNTYANNFADVPASEWYAKEVANAYELGLINGKSETAFDPSGNMTIAEAITLASRTRNAYGTADYDFTAAAGAEWFTPYVEYAVANGIIKEGEYSDFNALITRGQMAKIFAAALPSSEYAAINSVTVVPDVDKNADYASAVLKLYNAGIVMGNDAYGTYNPANNIIRAEAAAIINRIAIKDNRLSKNLLNVVPVVPAEPINMTSEAKYYMDDEVFRNAHTGGYPSGWSVYPTLQKSAKTGVLSYTLADSSEELKGYFERKIIPSVSDGVLDFEFGVNIYGDNGAYLKFVDEDGKSVIELLLERGDFKTLCADGTYVSTGLKQAGSLIHFDFKINVDKKTFDLGADGAYIGTFDFASDKAIAAFHNGVTEKGWVTLAPVYASLRHNWLATEKFVNAPDNILPYDLSIINEGGKVSKVIIDNANNNGGSLEIASKAGVKNGIYKQFAPASGNVVLETYILLPTDINGAKVALKNGTNDVFSLTTKDGNFVTADGTSVKYVTKNLWHIVRFEADTATDTAVVKINGKVVGSYPFTTAADVINGYEITYAPATESKMFVDEIAAFIKLPYPEDYVPEPVVPKSDDYLVGLNVCSLWRNGTHYGWDEITAYPEIEPVLGYYDEGSPETSDWEIKMMSEHGIDYQIFCWYADSDVKQPIFRTRMNESLIDGYMNARYSDKMKFAIMWENTSIDCKSWESWTEYFVPYFIEYFFLDDRYMVIDNKPLLTVWSYDALGKAFGDDHSPKQAFDYLREECKKVGFDGCMIMLYSSDHSTNVANVAKNQGFDCMGAYHYGSGGANLDKHLASLESLNNEKTIDRIPAVSVGFDYVGWGYSNQRNGLLDPANYPIITDYIKNEILAKRDQSSIYSKMVLISTWNEYGEGTYVMPTARHGFAYLDGVRAAFTNGGDHTDVTPTPAQKQRINYLFDQNRQWLRPQLLVEKKTEEVDPYAGAVEVHKITFEDPAAIKWTSYGDTTVENIDGILSITTTGKDPAIFSNSSICNVPATDANAVKIRARVYGDQTAGSMELFFRTNDGKEYAADKVKTHRLTLGEWKDYYFDFRGMKTWTGNIVNLRIDPANFVFEKAEIESITFVNLPEIVEKIPFTVDINGAEMPLIMEPDRTGGGLMLPLYPGEGDPNGYGVLARMKANHFWDKNTKELTVYNNSHTVTMFIGTDKIIIDGVEGKMYAATYMYDGLPVIPFDTLCEALGYFVVEHEDGNGVSIMLNSADDYYKINNREPYKYEFELEGDLEDWTLQGCTLDTYGGFLVGNSNSNDPAVTSPALNIEAEKYPTIKVGMKYDRQNVGKNDHVAIFFKTANAGLSESRKVTIDLGKENVSSNGEIVEFTFDMNKHLQWYGKITGIRFDPFNAPGTFEIDYIRFEKDMAAEMAELEQKIREENLDDTIYNGDANNVSYPCCYADGSSAMKIVERDDEPGNNCFEVYSAGGKVWTYIKQKVKFTPGTSYIVEFDVRTLGKNNGEASPDISSSYVVNAMYNGADHIVHASSAKVSDGWVHMKVEVNIPSSCNNENDIISIYSNPNGDSGVNYQIDNWKMYPME